MRVNTDLVLKGIGADGLSIMTRKHQRAKTGQPLVSVDEGQGLINALGLGHTEGQDVAQVLERHRGKVRTEEAGLLIDALIDYYSDSKSSAWHLANRLDFDWRRTDAYAEDDS